MRATFASLVVLALALAGCDRRDQPKAPSGDRPAGATIARAPPAQAGMTPMAERVAVLGLLNKRNGIVRDLTLKPGQSVRVKDVVVRLRACETTAPWENEALTGAFVQLDVERRDGQWQRMFSGWLYEESPSLNVVEHPVYDVWPKSCAMTYPAGPSAPDAPVASSNRSSARKSGGTSGERPDSGAAEPAIEPGPVPPPAEAPPPSAAANNAT